MTTTREFQIWREPKKNEKRHPHGVRTTLRGAKAARKSVAREYPGQFVYIERHDIRRMKL